MRADLQKRQLLGTSMPPKPVNADLPEKPSWLSGRANAEWDRVVPDLIEKGLVIKIDSFAIAAYCEMYADFSENPGEFPSSKMTQLRLLMTDLGMTPSSRAKTKFAHNAAKPADPWDEFANPTKQ
jgi:phage terminase small subunit